MSSDAYRRVGRGIIEMINKGDLSRIEEFIAPDAVDHQSPPGSGAYDGIRGFVATFREAFPDLTITIDQEIEEGDTLATRFTMTGTHRGAFMGAAPTGKQIRVSGVDIMRFGPDGRVAEHWGYQDDMGFMQQLGLMPPMS